MRGKDAVLEGALGRQPCCPSLEELAQCLEGNAPLEVKTHMESCSYCKAEVDLLKDFLAAEARPEEEEGVASIQKRLREQRASWLRHQSKEDTKLTRTWWHVFFPFPKTMAVAAAALLVFIGWGIFSGAGQILIPPPAGGHFVVRSGSVRVEQPSGQVRQPPELVAWDPVEGANHYQVLLLEVDQSAVWEGESAGTTLEIPSEIRKLIRPSKRMLVRVKALDQAGQVVGDSGLVDFRVAPQ